MPMNSRILSSIRNKLKSVLKNREVVDIILFGSFVKGKVTPRDVDIAIISEKVFKFESEGFHVSFIKPIDFFVNPPTLATTLLREGYSLKADKPLSETLRFKSSVMFVYSLTSLTNSKKVRIVNVLRGKNKQKGLVEEYEGEWLSTNIFLIKPSSEHLFEQFFLEHEVKFKKTYLLIH